MKALEFYEKALNIDKKNFGEDHPDIAIDYNNIGKLLLVWDGIFFEIWI